MLTVKPLPAFQDNYIWLLQQDTTSDLAVVDPGDATPVIDYIERHGLALDTILITHHHNDHTGGLAELAERYSPRIIGPHNDKIKELTENVGEGDSFRLLGRRVEVLETPGHTLDHISFLLPGTPSLLLCGDTLFCGGCGRLFEGTPEQMFGALERFKQFSDDTLVFGAHEYTLANLAFAQAAEPDNAERDALLKECERARALGRPTLPTTIGRECAINPFLRADKPALQNQAAEQGDTVDALSTFKALRAWKDNF
ncbi:hydroxyacylglutathione hydrolase [Phytohalomonas tamaricis]|uniref:hydroxyacylglutathione hydrolase n=1 Tax=Phytohalomonas tamaricis TaxID=2081032 RepID=UPI000D0B0423|nr:hydroxyacylglutathione hydrolase [Phytohalomonas tamaricis]